jgi:hypothetical protein
LDAYFSRGFGRREPSWAYSQRRPAPPLARSGREREREREQKEEVTSPPSPPRHSCSCRSLTSTSRQCRSSAEFAWLPAAMRPPKDIELAHSSRCCRAAAYQPSVAAPDPHSPDPIQKEMDSAGKRKDDWRRERAVMSWAGMKTIRKYLEPNGSRFLYLTRSDSFFADKNEY